MKTRSKKIFFFLSPQEREADLRTAESVDKGHGRIDKRSIETLSKFPSMIDFPGAKQIARIRRERIKKGVSTVETICLITSLSRVHADAAALLEIVRSHWSIENGVHRVRDVTLGEDACTVASGDAPQVLAALRNAVLTLFRQNKITKVARALRKFNSDPLAAIKLLGKPVEDF